MSRHDPNGLYGVSAFRFVDELPPEEHATLWNRLRSDELPVEFKRRGSGSWC